MKKLFLLCCIMLSFTTLSSFAQNVPAKLLRSIEVSKDEFTGTTTYSAKDCCLSIVRDSNSVKLYISLACSSFDIPIKLNKIYVLTGGNTTIIERNNDFSSKENPVRVMSRNATGTFGTSSYRGAEFTTRIQYTDIWKTNAIPYLSMIESIINNFGKVKFEGENNTLYLEFGKKEVNKISAILRLYSYLVDSSSTKI